MCYGCGFCATRVCARYSSILKARNVQQMIFPQKEDGCRRACLVRKACRWMYFSDTRLVDHPVCFCVAWQALQHREYRRHVRITRTSSPTGEGLCPTTQQTSHITPVTHKIYSPALQLQLLSKNTFIGIRRSFEVNENLFGVTENPPAFYDRRTPACGICCSGEYVQLARASRTPRLWGRPRDRHHRLFHKKVTHPTLHRPPLVLSSGLHRGPWANAARAPL